MEEKNTYIPKWLIFSTFAVVIFFVLYLVYTFIGETLAEIFTIIESGNEQAVIDYLNSKSQLGGYFTLYILVILQVISIVVPGILIQVSGALMYGWLRSFIICYVGFISGNAVVFTIAKMFGKSLAFISDSHHKKESWLANKMNDGHPQFVVALAFMIPGIPNGIVPYLASRTKMTLREYVQAVSVSCWPQIALNCVAGHFIRSGDYVISIATFALQILLIVIVTLNHDRLLKK